MGNTSYLAHTPPCPPAHHLSLLLYHGFCVAQHKAALDYLVVSVLGVLWIISNLTDLPGTSDLIAHEAGSMLGPLALGMGAALSQLETVSHTTCFR